MTKGAILKHIGELPERYDGIASIFLFGSFTRTVNFADVDLAIVFARIQDTVKARQISREFFSRFGVPLHIQMFFEEQRTEIDRFLRAAEPWDRVYG